jgi:enoyl-CoA hydratase
MDAVQLAIDGRVAVVTINRPDVRNAVDRPTAEALADVFRRFDCDEDLSVAVLAGADGTFCAGADLKAIAAGRGNRVAHDGDGPLGISRMLLSKPTIAAVEGYAVAGGLELALWCDLRVAAPSSVFGVFCRRWGVPLMDGGTVRLARLIGQSHALDMVLTGRGVGGEEALRIGLVNRLVPSGSVLEAAIALAKDIAKWPQRCMRSDRLALYEQWQLTVEDALASETRHGFEVIQAGEMWSGVDVFTQGADHRGSLRHVVLGTPMQPPWPAEMESAMFAMGRVEDAERKFWQADGVYTTAVGTASAPGGDREVVCVVYDPRKTSFDALLRIFWESHDPTADAAAPFQSAIFCSSDAQRSAAEISRQRYQRALSAAGRGEITTEVVTDAPAFDYADAARQQYLARHPEAAAAASGTGVRYPVA